MLIHHVLQRKGADVVTITADAPLTGALSTLAEHNIGAIVVADDQGAVVGIISERDVVRALAARGPVALQGAVGDRHHVRSPVDRRRRDGVDDRAAHPPRPRRRERCADRHREHR
jgi:CBS domain-containing protein